ncbi:MAG: IS110 family transposase [Planctomycetes bacterium]|nr:IS110 family transposase [Planctomycetota bacterium]
MLYLGIDQHSKQLTVDLGNEAGDVVQHQQVKTDFSSLRTFFAKLKQRSEAEGGFMACLEICGFNDYLLKELQEHGCREIVLIQPQKRQSHKSDRRDARGLRDLLWVHRHALQSGKRLPGIRRVRLCSAEEAAQRQITSLRKRLGKVRTQTINRVRRLLRKHNLQHDCPTQGIATLKARAWLRELCLPEIDRVEMDILLQEWAAVEEQIDRVSAHIKRQQADSKAAMIVASMPGMGSYSSLAVGSRIGNPHDFRRGTSLANFVGLAPGCNNTGETRRVGSITKEGSSMIRFILGQVTLHVLRKDPWMKKCTPKSNGVAAPKSPASPSCDAW